MVYAFLAFIVFFLLVSSALLLLFYRELLGQRLAGILASRTVGAQPTLSKVQRAAESLGGFAGSIQKVMPKSEKETSVVQKRLVMAGYREKNHINVFYAFKAIAPLLLCVAAFATGAYQWSPFVVFLTAMVIGYLAPDYWLGHRITARQNDIRLGLPDVLDLLVVCLEAGLSLDQAVLRATDELSFSHPVIGDELGLVMLEVRAGRSRVDAWRSLAERTDVDAVRMLVSILVQADQFGTGISKTLRIHSDTMRTRRKQRVEEVAAKTAVKLVFPLVLFIFPSLFVVTLGPALILISEGL